VYILLFTNLSLIVVYTLYFIDTEHYWLLWSVDGMVSRVLYLNILYSIFFTFFYVLLLKIFGSNFNYKYGTRHNYRIKYFVILYFVVSLVNYGLLAFSMSYLYAYWSNVVDLAFMMVFALLLSKVKSIKNIIIFCIVALFYLVLFHYPMLDLNEQYTVNKGGAVMMVLFALVFIDITKKKRIFTIRRLILGFLFLPIFLGFVNYVESIVTGSPASFTRFLVYIAGGYELRMMENQAVVLNSIDNNLAYSGGNTYLNAINDFLFPFKNRELSAANWLANYITYGQKVQAQYALSAIAEGVMNYGKYGAIVAALISAFILYMLRVTLQKQWFISPIIYASLFILPYYLYRSDMQYILKKVQISLISVLIVTVIYFFLKKILTKKVKKY
jgi:hypothetical protein